MRIDSEFLIFLQETGPNIEVKFHTPSQPFYDVQIMLWRRSVTNLISKTNVGVGTPISERSGLLLQSQYLHHHAHTEASSQDKMREPAERPTNLIMRFSRPLSGPLFITNFLPLPEKLLSMSIRFTYHVGIFHMVWYATFVARIDVNRLEHK